MKMFDCVKIEGVWWLSADMRLQCYRGDWYGYALYALIIIVALSAVTVLQRILFIRAALTTTRRRA